MTTNPATIGAYPQPAHLTLLDLLRRYAAHRARPRDPDTPPPTFRVITMANLCALSEDDHIDGALAMPVRSILRARAREIGWNCWARGGIKGMHALFAAMEAAQSDRENLGATLDKWWDGIGNGSHVWTA